LPLLDLGIIVEKNQKKSMEKCFFTI